jgi:retron-type reverse transcriptase
MGLFDFLRRLFFGGGPGPQAPGPRMPSPPRPQAPAPQTSWPAASAPQPPGRAQQPPQRREVTLDLDAAQFQPLSADQVKAAAEGQTFSNFFQFGRQSRIPSAIDPRTKLIDQAMVGQGLMSPEELVRIHELGERMDEMRPEQSGASAYVAAERAAQADKEARKRIKAEKKAAAEERRRQHAARVAHNRLTDIVYLGRGVSVGLSDRRSNVEKLQAQGLPVLSTPAEVAAALGVTVPKLRWLAFHAEATTRSHYVQFLVPKKSGGERTLCAPHQQLAAAQHWVLENILRKIPAHDAAHGFVPGRSILTNATAHVGSAVVINCDLRDFFPSITVRRVIGLFKHAGYSPAAATVLALLVTEPPRRKVLFQGKTWYVAAGPRALPQGACTSPDISNLVARRLDARLGGIGRKLGWTYTRYADDLSLSSKEPAPDKIGYLLARVRHIAQDEGFEVNEAKTRVLKRAARQTVTGVVTNEKPSAPRPLRRRLRAILHNAQKTGLPAQNRRREQHFGAWLAGTIEFVAMVNPAQGQKLKARLAQLRP